MAAACSRPGCTRAIEGGYCNTCGMAGAAPPAAPRPAAPRNAASLARILMRCLDAQPSVRPSAMDRARRGRSSYGAPRGGGGGLQDVNIALHTPCSHRYPLGPHPGRSPHRIPSGAQALPSSRHTPGGAERWGSAVATGVEGACAPCDTGGGGGLLAAWFSAQPDRPVASETPAAANVARNAGRRRREPIRGAYLTGTTLRRARGAERTSAVSTRPCPPTST
jgi:hypothetical protein